ncbi:hypothetical protein [Brevibacterium sp. JSBI002]|uniref:hypothetical protein n=1 Tax=Brevibacterium sp. JSBI002 TaxID=2886045 RepID=UPI0022320878|nr:hypothetical protein [Brevibacterium sp. JSBI002]UZD61358.1 hypothetical protein LJ362_11780 [Brevibacterium sp. JSBI002]
MRYTFAVMLMVVGVVVGGLGILQKTLWAPEDTITATAQIDADKPAVIVDPGMLNLYETPATLEVKGSGDLTIAQAPIENVEAWAGQSAYDRVTGIAEGGKLTVKATDGEGKVPNPPGPICGSPRSPAPILWSWNGTTRPTAPDSSSPVTAKPERSNL